MRRSLKQVTSFLFLLTLFSGCLRTQIKDETLSPDIFRLASLRNQALVLEIDSSKAVPKALGSQFVFLLIPFGTLEFEHFDSYLWRKAYTALTLGGYKPVRPDSPLAPQSSRLLLKVKTVSSNAYDLLFIRRLVSKIEIEAEFTAVNSSPAYWSGTFSENSWERQAFRVEVEKSMELTVNKALNEILEFVRRNS